MSIDFPAISASDLFETYMVSERHAETIGAPAAMACAEGADFHVFGENGVRGRTLVIVPNRMVVQSWRGGGWQPGDLDSTLILVFEDTQHGARLAMVHVNIPDQAYAAVNEQGRKTMYWDRWKEHFSQRLVS